MHHPCRRPLATLGVAAVCAGAACASAACGGARQTVPADVAPPPVAMLLPGSRELTLAQFGDDEQRLRLVVRRDGADSVEREIARLSRRVRRSGRELVLSSVYDPRYGVVDTLVASAATFAPRTERLRLRAVEVVLHYDGARVTGTRQSGDSTPTAFDRQLDVPVFAFNQLEALVRSIPLREGYRTVVPLFSEVDLALERDTLAVVGRIDGGRVKVRFADPMIVATYVVDTATRRIAAAEILPRRGGARIRYLPDE